MGATLLSSARRIVVFFVLLEVVAVAVVIIGHRMHRPALSRTHTYDEPFQEDNEGRMPMFIINLDKRPDRLQTTTELLEQSGFTPLTRVRAVDGAREWKNMKHLVVPDALKPVEAGERTENNQLTPGAVGCYVTHVGMWQRLATDDAEGRGYVIFEDDTQPTMSADEVDELLRRVPDDWDIVLFGAVYDDANEVNAHVNRVKRFVCLHAYAVSKRAAALLPPRAYPMSQQLDWWLSDLAERGEINIYAFKDSRWHQNDKVNASNIQNRVVGDDGR